MRRFTLAPEARRQQRISAKLPVMIWLAGIAMYHLSSRYTPALGAALPTLVATFAVAWLTRPQTKA